jgi:hypothetical protein
MIRKIAIPSTDGKASATRGVESVSLTAWMSRLVPALKVLPIVVILTTKELHAYVDPGTGSMLWQALLAGALGAMFYLRKIVSWFRTHDKRKGEQGRSGRD